MLQNLSLKLVYCDLFENQDDPKTLYKDSYLPINTFLKQFFHHMPHSKLWLVVKTKKNHFGIQELQDFHPTNIKHQKTKSLLIYEVWYVTWEPNELQKGHEGQTHAFQFVKIDGNFKFYGMTSIP